MKILKVLNNNAVVFKEGGVEKIAMGPGIAFQKGKNDLINAAKVEKVFVMKEEQEKFQELLKNLPEEHIQVAEEIISYAEQQLAARTLSSEKPRIRISAAAIPHAHQ